ncbi:hypothetical protein GCM10009548_43140 [Streptomyces malaysiensis subsp. malaysiensis]
MAERHGAVGRNAMTRFLRALEAPADGSKWKASVPTGRFPFRPAQVAGTGPFRTSDEAHKKSISPPLRLFTAERYRVWRSAVPRPLTGSLARIPPE